MRLWSEVGRPAAMGLLAALLALPVAAQTQSLQAWPEIDTYVSLNSDVRVSFFAAATRENRQGTSAEVGPNIDFYFKPLVKLKKITLFELDPSKSRLLIFRAGYRYMPSKDGSTEHRGLLEATARYPLVRGILLSDRNRLDLRFIDGEFAWRYRNRLSAKGPSQYFPTTSRPISGPNLTRTAIFTNGAGPPKVLAASFRSASGTSLSPITNIRTKLALLRIDR
jgi:hypothetical protein